MNPAQAGDRTTTARRTLVSIKLYGGAMSGGATQGVTAIEALYARALADPSRGGRRILEGRRALDSLLQNSDSDVQPRGVRRLLAPEAIAQAVAGLSGSLTTELAGLLPTLPDPTAAMRSSRTADLDLLAKGVSLRLIYEPAWVEEPGALRGISELVGAGAEARVIDRVPHRLIVFDRTVAMLPIDVTGRRTGALVIHEQPIVASLRALFTSIWRRAEPASDASAGRLEVCQPRDRSILELMSTGVTDELAARRLDVSVRTYRRHVADLMERLGARSRFQAGVVAVERGWL